MAFIQAISQFSEKKGGDKRHEEEKGKFPEGSVLWSQGRRGGGGRTKQHFLLAEKRRKGGGLFMSERKMTRRDRKGKKKLERKSSSTKGKERIPISHVEGPCRARGRKKNCAEGRKNKGGGA